MASGLWAPSSLGHHPTCGGVTNSPRSPRLLSAFVVLAVVGLFTVEQPLTRANAVDVRRDAFVMGTRVTMVTYAPDRATGLGRLDGFLRIIEATERELSTWIPDSRLSRLNRHRIRTPFTLDRRLCGLFRTLRHWHDDSAGTFDPAVGALIDVWGLRTGGALPREDDLSRARAVSGFQRLAFDATECTITRLVDATLDAGAFGKGEALDRVRAANLTDEPWLIDLGGQVAVHGRPPGREAWPVGLAHPHDRATPALEVRLAAGSLAVSGGSERDLRVRGRRVGHILDPRTGAPATFDGTVAVWHERALVADIQSTALAVMGPADGIPWADARDVATCYLTASRRGGSRQTSGVASRAFTRRFDGVCRSAMPMAHR